MPCPYKTAVIRVHPRIPAFIRVRLFSEEQTVTTLFAPCGLICSECEAYQATQANDSTAVARVAAEWTERYRIPFRPDDVWCDGCTSSSERTSRHCGQCPVRACVRERGLVTCAACREYPCDPLTRIHRLAPEARERLERHRDGRG